MIMINQHYTYPHSSKPDRRASSSVGPFRGSRSSVLPHPPLFTASTTTTTTDYHHHQRHHHHNRRRRRRHHRLHHSITHVRWFLCAEVIPPFLENNNEYDWIAVQSLVMDFVLDPQRSRKVFLFAGSKSKGVAETSESSPGHF
ncbi:uncharacterized protein LOC143041754 [Oratosquilla oratoria]|uniref:uncharacterized protein LOC143041754 n=1 Tax=Oratosquilla oratoria TaxID=337810 RepID=UPI003F776D4F